MMTIAWLRTGAALLGGAFFLVVGWTDVMAFGRTAPDYSSGYVTAESRSGNGEITAQVRPGTRGGYEYRVPGGSWSDCEGDCAVTITNKVLDFWDNQANRSFPGRGLSINVPRY